MFGIKSGIQIQNVRAEYDEERQTLKIYGKLCKRDYFIKKKNRPVIICEINDIYGRILSSYEGKIYGNLNLIEKTSFAFEIKDYSIVDWHETSVIQLLII